MEMKVTFTVTLPIQITKKAKWYLASCPALDVASQGETEEEAKKNVAEALFMFLRSCYERGTLDTVLKECGFTPDLQYRPHADSATVEGGYEYIDIPLHLLARFKDNQQCHRA